MKTCYKCKVIKDFSEFRGVQPGKGCKNNLHSWCRECTRAARRKDYSENKEKYAAWNASWNARYPEERRQLEANRDKEKKRSSYRIWIINNPEAKRANDHNYRARKVNAEGKMTAEIIESVFVAYGRRCLKCGSADNLQIDHVVPLMLGGSNLFNNLQPLCKSCNSAKRARNCNDYRPDIMSQPINLHLKKANDNIQL